MKSAASKTPHDRDVKIWQQLGVFSALICMGSLAGAAAWYAKFVDLSFDYEGAERGGTSRKHYVRVALSSAWYGAHQILYPVELCSLIIPKLMLLGRLTQNAMRSLQSNSESHEMTAGLSPRVGRALHKFFKLMSAAVVSGSVVVLVASILAGTYFIKAAGVRNQAAAACDVHGRYTNATLAFARQADDITSSARTSIFVQNVFESVILLLISVGYLVSVLFSVIVFRQAHRFSVQTLKTLSYRSDDSHVEVPSVFYPSSSSSSQQLDCSTEADPSGNPELLLSKPKIVALTKIQAQEIVQLTRAAAAERQRRYLAACVIVLVTFAARASYNVLNAYASVDAPYNSACGVCDSCQTHQYVISVWLSFTPEFQAVLVALSSPLPLFISLWLMISKDERTHLMFHGDKIKNYKNPQQQKAREALVRMGVDM